MKRCSNYLLDAFIRQVRRWGIALTGDQIALLEHYGRLLEGYDLANVIGTRVYERIMEDHVLDSLSCLLVPSFDTARNMVDIGTGGGLPGIPLKIARPVLSASLVESTAKKTSFLKYVALELGLEGVEILNARAENVGKDPLHRASYDVATTRAVSSLAAVAEYCVPLVRVGGQVVAMKGRITTQELKEGTHAAELLGARVAKVLLVPLLAEVRAEERCLVVLEKIRETPARYPRKPGEARKHPLGVGN